MAVDMTRLAVHQSATDVALLSGDSDHIPGLEVAKEKGLSITLWHGSKTSTDDELRKFCHKRRQLTPAIVDTIAVS